MSLAAISAASALAGAATAAVEPAPLPQPATAAPTPPPDARAFADVFERGKIIFEVRPRYEGVSQDGLVNRADAYTVRTHVGWESGSWNGFKGIAELANVTHIDPVHYNTTINGRKTYPVVGDPDFTQLNRLQLAWTPGRYLTTTVGRQRILIDDQRFVGNANWRQDEQTFDAVKSDANYGRLRGSYIYMWKVNRVFARTLDWKSDSHLFNVKYAYAEPLLLEGFYYDLRFTTPTAAAKAASTATWGAKLSGKARVSLFQLAYNATYARQTAAGTNPSRFGLDYWGGDVAGTFDIYTVKASYEQLGGDGQRGFATPLATLHAFQGWADVFLTTPAAGIRDANVSAMLKPRYKSKYLHNIELFARYHQFYYQQNAGSLGSEIDLQATAAISPKISLTLKDADYFGVAKFPSRNKVMVGFEYKY